MAGVPGVTTQPPAWATDIPNRPVNAKPAKSFQVSGPSQDQLDAMRSMWLQSILQQVVLAVKNVLISNLDPFTQLQEWAQGVEADAADGGGAWTQLEAFLLTGKWSDLKTAWQDLLGGNPVLTSDGSSVDLIATAQQWLRNVLTPGGALTSWTTIPAHLFSHLGPSLLENLLPDGEFNISTALDGESIWSFDATQDHTGTSGSGSAKVAAASNLEQLIGVPVQVIDGQTVQLGAYVRWSGVSASAGNAIALAVNAYDVNDGLISDPTNRIVDAITSPPTNSTGASGLVDTQGNALTPDSDGWVPLVGQYITPTGTKYVRLCCEVESVVSAGSVWFDDCSLWCPVIDSTLLGNLENHPILGPDRVAGIGGLTDLETTLLGWMTKFTGALGTDSTDSTWFANLLNTLSGRASDAHDKAIDSQNTLAIINNKPINAGLKRTVESNGDINTMTTMAPNVTQATGSAGATLVIGQAKTFSFVQWYGKMNTAFSAGQQFIINFYKLNTTTGDFELLFSSPDLSSTLSTTADWNFYNLATALTAAPGDIIGIGFQVVGSLHAYQFAGWNVLAGAYASATAKHQAFSQAWGTSAASTIPAASIGWGVLQNSGTFSVPYVGLGVTTLPATVLAPLVLSATSPGSFSSMVDGDGNVYTNVPAGYSFADLGVIGGGGGGGGGTAGGGNNGSATTLNVGIHTKTSTSNGAGGSGGAFGASNIARAYGDAPSPQNLTIGGQTLFGGDEVGPQATGSAPGGGAGGGHLGNDYGWGGLAAQWSSTTSVSIGGGEALSGTVAAGGTGRSGALSGSPGDGAPGAAYVVLRQS